MHLVYRCGLLWAFLGTAWVKIAGGCLLWKAVHPRPYVPRTLPSSNPSTHQQPLPIVSSDLAGPAIQGLAGGAGEELHHIPLLPHVALHNFLHSPHGMNLLRATNSVQSGSNICGGEMG